MNSVRLTTSWSSSRQAPATSPARWRRELLLLVDSGTIRVIDALILTKNEDGTVEGRRSRGVVVMAGVPA